MMNRDELPLSDKHIIALLNENWGIVVDHFEKANFGGSYFSFIVTTGNADKYFLKIYDEAQYHESPTPKIVDAIGEALYLFQHKYGLLHISHVVPMNDVEYCLTVDNLVFVLFEYIAGEHPSYPPTAKNATELAEIFSELHAIPKEEFAHFASENFDLSYAFVLKEWFQQHYHDEMWHHFLANKETILRSLETIEKHRDQLIAKRLPFVMTHGDGHPFNVLQNAYGVWLIDWDGIKIAPIERDLWFYENTEVIRAYTQLNPHFVLDHECCEFYRNQRFLHDIRYYLERVLRGGAKTAAQKDLDRKAFYAHWGWNGL